MSLFHSTITVMGANNKALSNKVIAIIIALIVATILAQVASAYFLTPKAILHLGEGKFTARIADTDASRIKGLSGTDSLPRDHAMVFIFEENTRHGIWMKDMNYSIDIVWLDEAKQVVDYVTNVPPSSYPNKSFFPREDARYVVELNSGVVKDKGIKVGQVAFFSGTSKDL